MSNGKKLIHSTFCSRCGRIVSIESFFDNLFQSFRTIPLDDQPGNASDIYTMIIDKQKLLKRKNNHLFLLIKHTRFSARFFFWQHWIQLTSNSIRKPIPNLIVVQICEWIIRYSLRLRLHFSLCLRVYVWWWWLREEKWDNNVQKLRVTRPLIWIFAYEEYYQEISKWCYAW